MKLRTLLISLVLASFLVSLFAADETEAPPQKQLQARGANTFGEETIETLQTTGLVKLNRTTISQNLAVNGSLISQGAQIGTIDVVGEAHLTDTTIQRGGSIVGYLQTHHSTILQPLVLNGHKAIFTTSKLAGLTIKQMDGFKGKQIVELRQKTVVDGPITFESGKGEIHLYPGSQIIGPVKGGKVVRKN
jgi:hypothetical protein